MDSAISQLPELKLIETIEIDDVVTMCVDLLCDGHVVGWFQGDADFGPLLTQYPMRSTKV